VWLEEVDAFERSLDIIFAESCANKIATIKK